MQACHTQEWKRRICGTPLKQTRLAIKGVLQYTSHVKEFSVLVIAICGRWVQEHPFSLFVMLFFYLCHQVIKKWLISTAQNLYNSLIA